MKRKLKKIFALSLISLSIIGAVSKPVMASVPKRHVAYRYVWGVSAETEWACRHYTRAWLAGLGSDSGRNWGNNLTRAKAIGAGTAHTRYGR